jgi:hypothetical protein
MVKIKKIITHPKAYDMLNKKKYGSWIEDILDFDFSLLLLDSDVEFTNSIQPICIPSANNLDYSNKESFASGWGVTKVMKGKSKLRYEGASDVPKIAKLRVIPNDRCDEKFTLCDYCAKPTIVCTYGNHHNKSVIVDACQGDSGGIQFYYS